MSTVKINDLTLKAVIDGTEVIEISEGGAGSFKTTLAAVVAGLQLVSQKNQANGYAGLDASTLLNVGQIPIAIPAINIADGSVDNTEFQRLNGLTSAIEEQGNKGAVSGYAGLDASQLLLLANFPTGTGLQVLRRNAGNTALEFATLATGITTLNSDTAAVQTLSGTANRITVTDVTPDHAFDIAATYVGQASITTLGTITSGVWNGTDIALANIANGTANQIIKTNAGGIALEFGLIANANVDASAAIVTSKLADSANFVLINQANVFGDFNQTFKDNRILIESPDGLTPITIVNLQQTLARNLTIPILTGNRTIVVTTEASQIALGTEVTGASTDLSDSANLARNTNNLSFFAATTSAQLLGVISDETGSGLLVFGTSPTIVTPTIASFANAGHNHQDAAGGGTLLSTSALSDTANIAYLNTANTYVAGTRQDFLGLLAGTAGLNVGSIAGNPTTQIDGDVWYNSTSNILFGRINGVDVDLGQSGGGSQTPIAQNVNYAEFNIDNLGQLTQHKVNTTAVYELFADHTTPADGQVIGQLDFQDDNSAGGQQETYGQIKVVIQDPTSGTEDAEMFFAIMNGGGLVNFLKINEANDGEVSLGVTLNTNGSNVIVGNGQVRFNTTAMEMHANGDNLVTDVPLNGTKIFRINNASVVTLTPTTILQDGSNATVIHEMFADHTTPADAQVIGQINFQDETSAGGQQFTYAQIRSVIQSPTSGTEDAELFFSVEDGSGSLVNFLKINEASDGFVSFGVSLELIDHDVVLGTTTGTKYGTSNLQKQAWWNATPVVQPAHIADPTGGATVDAEARTAINSILAQLATTGLQAAS